MKPKSKILIVSLITAVSIFFLIISLTSCLAGLRSLVSSAQAEEQESADTSLESGSNEQDSVAETSEEESNQEDTLGGTIADNSA